MSAARPPEGGSHRGRQAEASLVSAAAPSRWRVRFPSLGARLVALFVVLALAVAVTFTLGTQVRQRVGWHEYMRPLVMNYTDMLVAEIGSPPDVERARLLTQRLPLRIRIEGPQVNWDSADEPPPEQAPLGDGLPGRGSRHPVVTLPNGDPLPLVVPQTGFEHAGPALRGGAHAPPIHLALGAEIDPTSWRVVRRLPDGYRIIFGLADMSHETRAENVGWATLALLLLFTALAYAWVRHMLHPLVALRAGAVRYGQGDFSQPIVPRNRDELGDLAEQVNAMAARLHHMLDAKRQLLLAISHELRSPLARARMNAELIDDSGERSALLRDLGEMRDLITDLLESERLADVQAGGHAALQTEASSLTAIVHEQCDAQAEAGTLALSLDEALPTAALDRARVRLLLRNLVDNALRHGGEAARVPVVTTSGDACAVRLVVRDFGPGMAEAQLQHATEAFYRADTARLRSTGGVGLGLYLCKLVAEAHGGTLALRNALPGLEITATLPLGAGSPLA
jgi:signal transduction histidine kinase